MPPKLHSPKDNHLLGAIPEAEWDRFAKHLTPVRLGLGDVIYESGIDQPLRLLSDGFDRVAAVCHAGWIVRGNRDRRQ